MLSKNLLCWASLFLFVPSLACTLAKQTPQPSEELQQLSFEIQTATPTTPAVLSLVDPNATTVPKPTPTATLVVSQEVTASTEITATQEELGTDEPDPTPTEETVVIPTNTPIPQPTATVPLAEPLQGGEWDFETEFVSWGNPHGDACPGSGLATGWTAFTTRDQFGSSCFNKTDWADNVFTGVTAQEITFAYVGNQAGIFKTAPTIPGHQYTIEAHMKLEFSPAEVEVSLGVDLTGNVNWQAESVQWFLWNEAFDNQWSTTEETITAEGEGMTIFIKGSHPYPEPGGTLRLDSIRVVDIGPAGE